MVPDTFTTFSQIQKSKIRPPRAHGTTIPFGHRFRYLMKMIQIVNNPCCEQLPQIDNAKDRMLRFSSIVIRL